MSSNSDRGPNVLAILGGLASIATIIGVIIAYFAYIHPISSSSSSDSSSISSGTASNQSGQSGQSGGQSGQSGGQSSSVDVAGAKSTINVFCEYLNSGAVQNAYNLTSNNYQSQHTIDQFTNQFNDMDLNNGGCEYNTPIVSGQNVTVSLTTHRIDINNGGATSSTTYTVTLIRDAQSSSWIIDNIQ